jgi:NAD(P)-dependent dehydrogenase (short-subunit alcohol dehydrogenase family)
LDGAFNCGGVDGPKASILDCSLDDWDQILGINLRGTFLLVKHELAIMVPQGSGTIINMSSVCATIARPGRVAYNTSRHGVDAITKTAALEYASKGIRINAIAPGSIRTDIFHRSTQGDPTREKQYNQAHPIGRIGEPEEVAQAALWLLSDAPDFMQGHTLMLDGGFTIQ